MSAKFDGIETKKGDIFYIRPEDVQADEASNGRWLAHAQEAIDARVASYEYMSQGQLEPVQVRKVDGKPTLILGFLRWKAALAYNLKHPESPMRLKCVLVNVNSEEALVRNVTENRERENLTCMDLAFSQRIFREVHGWTDARIAEFYRVSEPYVGQLKKLLSLPRDLQEKVHRKTLPFETALSLADLPEKEQREVVAELESVTAPGAKLSSKAGRKAVRQRKQKNGKKLARSMSEVRDFFHDLSGPALPVEVRMLATLMLDFVTGKITDSDMEDRLSLLFAPQETGERVAMGEEMPGF